MTNDDNRRGGRRSFLRRSALVSAALLTGCSADQRSATTRDDGTRSRTESISSSEDLFTQENAGSSGRPTESERTGTTEAGRYPGYENLPDPLDVDSSNPLIYLNDHTTDNYMGELALAMADSGTADLRGFLMSYPREVWINTDKYQRIRSGFIENHKRVHRKAIQSGMTDLPPPQFGVFDQHDKPASGRIEDTDVIGSEGTRLIVEEARNASPEKPVVVAAGGDLCTIADAYLKDPSIADSLVVYWHEQVADINSQSGYNVQNSGWSAYVALSRLSTVLDHNRGGFVITREEVEDRIPSPLDEYMMTKEHWKWGNPLRSTDWSERGEWDAGDEKALLLAAYPGVRDGSNPMTVSGVQQADWPYNPKDVLPTVSPGDPDSKLIEIPGIQSSTEAFWRSWR
jgi:hypothetical protein